VIDDRDRIVLSKTTSVGRGLPVILIVALLAGVLAVVKPWGSSAPGPRASPASSGSAGAAASARPTRAPLPTADPASVPCLTYSDWRAMVIERSATDETRHWMAVDPVAAEGPDDPAIPFVAVGSEHVVGLGVCAPDDVRFSGPPRVYRLLRRGPQEVSDPAALRQLVPPGTRLATIYAAPGRASTWTSGIYAIGFPTTSRAAWGVPAERLLWFGVRILAIER
jgi:hypothetical protein